MSPLPLLWVGLFGCHTASTPTPEPKTVVKGPATDAGEDIGEDAILEGVQVPKIGDRLDRVSRPETSNFMVREPGLKPAYNGKDSFTLSADDTRTYTAMFKTSLQMYDAYDGVTDMDDAMVTRLATILVDDTLRIDLSKPCSADGYFDLERAELLGTTSVSCGGRTPNEDAFDTLATVFTNGPAKLQPRVSDKVDHSTGISGSIFPYLAEPHPLTDLLPK